MMACCQLTESMKRQEDNVYTRQLVLWHLSEAGTLRTCGSSTTETEASPRHLAPEAATPSQP